MLEIKSIIKGLNEKELVYKRSKIYCYRKDLISVCKELDIDFNNLCEELYLKPEKEKMNNRLVFDVSKIATVETYITKNNAIRMRLKKKSVISREFEMLMVSENRNVNMKMILDNINLMLKQGVKPLYSHIERNGLDKKPMKLTLKVKVPYNNTKRICDVSNIDKHIIDWLFIYNNVIARKNNRDDDIIDDAIITNIDTQIIDVAVRERLSMIKKVKVSFILEEDLSYNERVTNREIKTREYNNQIRGKEYSEKINQMIRMLEKQEEKVFKRLYKIA